MKRHASLHKMGQLPLIAVKSDVSSFDNFLADGNSSNIEAVDLLKKMVVQGLPSPYFLHGIPGSGKTHLLLATMRALHDKGIVNTFYFDLRSSAISPEVIHHLEQPKFVCIDNIDNWAGDNLGEQVLFSIIERAKQNDWPLLISASYKPNRLGIELPDLVSRLNSGVVYGLAQLDDQAKFVAIQLRAKYRGLIIKDDAIRYLLTHYARDNKSLFAIIDELDKASLVAKRKVTVPFLQQVLSA